MSKQATEQPHYGNWVPAKLIYIPGAIALLFLGFSLLLPVLILVTLLFFLMSIYFAYARYKFSAKGGMIQQRVQDLVLQHLDWDGEGKVIDIGCGNGPLTIKIAKKYPHTQIIGIDYWGRVWEYSKSLCEQNAKLEGVNDRATFQRASAAALPFEDEFFDAAVSNLVFHEVKGVRDKRDVIKEALRVVKKGGTFAFQDLFLMKRAFGNMDDLLPTIQNWGIESVAFANTSISDFILEALRLPFMLGTIGVLYGKK